MRRTGAAVLIGLMFSFALTALGTATPDSGGGTLSERLRSVVTDACRALGAALPADAAGAASAWETKLRGKWIYVSVLEKRLTLFEGGTALNVFPIATGALDTPTPTGVFRVNGRFASEMSGFGTRFLGLNVPWGQYGMHGTNKPNSIGSSASHGCIRLRVKDAETLYRLVPNGTPVVIVSGAYGDVDGGLKPLTAGNRGNLVLAVQKKLRALGFYQGGLDGIYGQGLEAAVRRARKALGLRDAAGTDGAFYQAIGLIAFE